MAGGTWELFDHTADMGILVRASTLNGLIEPAGQGLYAVIGDLIAGGHGRSEGRRLENSDRALLLRDYLNELLVLFDRERRIVIVPVVESYTDHELVVSGTSLLVDQGRSDYHREVKAVTYHGLAVHPVEDGFEATVIVDI